MTRSPAPTWLDKSRVYAKSSTGPNRMIIRLFIVSPTTPFRKSENIEAFEIGKQVKLCALRPFIGAARPKCLRMRRLAAPLSAIPAWNFVAATAIEALTILVGVAVQKFALRDRCDMKRTSDSRH